MQRDDLGPLYRPPSVFWKRAAGAVLGIVLTAGLVWVLLTGGSIWKGWANREFHRRPEPRVPDGGVPIQFLPSR